MKFWRTNAIVCLCVVFFALCALATGCSEDKEAVTPKASPAASQPDSPATSPAAAPAPQSQTKPAQPFAVTGITITDREVLLKNKPFTVSFSAPIVPAEKVGQKNIPEAEIPVIISPSVEGEGFWLKDDTFAFQASKPFPRGRDYKVIVKDTITSLDGGPLKTFFSFSTPPLEITHLGVSKVDNTDNTLDISFTVSAPVAPAQLERHLSFVDAASGEVLQWSLPHRAESTTTFLVRVAMEKYRPKITATLADNVTGAAADEALGLRTNFVASLNIPDPATLANPATSGVVVEKESQAAPSPQTINWAYNYWDSETGNGIAYFYLDEAINQKDFANYIKVEPNLPFSLGDGSRSIVIDRGVEPASTITLTLLPGLVDDEGRTLESANSRSLNIGNRQARVAFNDPGQYLTPSYGGSLAIRYSNIARVDVTLTEIFQNNLPFLGDVEDQGLFGRIVAQKQVMVTPEKNEIALRSVNVAELAGKKSGVFLLNLTGYVPHESNGQTTYYSSSSDTRLVVLSDLGLVVRDFPKGLTVFASSLSRAKPLSGVLLEAYSRSNQLVFSGVTNADGVHIHQRSEAWENGLEPYTIVARRGDDLTFVVLADPAHVPLSIAADREYLESGYEAFVYTPRGVFRPGEEVQLKAFVRDSEGRLPATSFPVELVVENPRGYEAARLVSHLSNQGGADFAFTLPPSAPTGEYIASLVLPGQKDEPLGTASFKAEDFVPPRLEVSIAADRPVFFKGETVPVAIGADYLFGAPGSGLNFGIGYRTSPLEFAPKGYERFVFGDGERLSGSQTTLDVVTGTLSDEGKSVEELTLPAQWSPAAGLKVMLLGTVLEDGGRPVTGTSTFAWYPSRFLIGVQVDTTTKADKLLVKAVALSPEGERASVGSMKAELVRINENWRTVRRDGRYVYTFEESFSPVASLAAESQNGEAVFTFDRMDYGRFLVVVTAHEDAGKPETAVTASTRFTRWQGGAENAPGSGRMDRVELSLDKEGYAPGDVARLEVKAPYAGTLFLGVEKYRQLHTSVIQMSGPATVLEIPVEQGMGPNSVVTAWVVRPVNNTDAEWFSHRAYGATSLRFAQKSYTLNVQAETPNAVKPASNLDIPFTVSDHEGMPVQGEFSVAFVDEGILSLTTFSTPSPREFFTALRQSRASTHDLYDLLLRPDAVARKIKNLLTPGGDGADAFRGSLRPQRIFLTAFLPTVTTDANGKATASFSLPEYSGKGRLMIVGAANSAFASTSAQITVTRDVEVEITTPRAVAPGDAFAMSIKGFSLIEGLAGKTRITLATAGPLAIAEEHHSFLLGETLHSIPVKAQEPDGIGTITLTAEVEGQPDLSFVRTVEMAVRAPFPRAREIKTATVTANNPVTIQPESLWSPENVQATLVFDNSPALAILPALDFLVGYPYGCLEQTTSRVWPYLALPSLQDSFQERAGNTAHASAQKVLPGAVARIASMQTADGGFSMWPGGLTSDTWKSVNATFFLVEAKALVPLPAGLLENALGYMRRVLAAPETYFSAPSVAYTTKAFAAFVLARAGEPPLGWVQTLASHEKEMLPSGRIFLAATQALVTGNAKPLQAMERVLPGLPKNLHYNETLESSMRNLALRLYAWTLVEPASPEAGNLCQSLATMLRSHRWFTTQEAGMASLAIGSYVTRNNLVASLAGTQATDNTISLRVDGSLVYDPFNILPNRLPVASDLFTTRSVSDSPSAAKGVRPLPVEVSVRGATPVFVSLQVQGTPAVAPKPFANGLRVERLWAVTNAEGKLVSVDPAAAPLTLHKGDRVKVALRVKADAPLAHVIISDLLPGGMELENPRLATLAAAEGDNGEEKAIPQDYYSRADVAVVGDIYMDARDDRLLVFVSQLNGEMAYEYTMRAVSTGTFVVPPLAAEGMYSPTSSALGPVGSVKVER